ncbi:SGNH/GDSL hydrolase family protein [Neptunomonas sp. XY-337]|uniref:SGNH/GDSL hydrolase family protein n=1 Tax=Neptunomonas sp. XY-337 TaxID=2561897 RepID=UPI0010AB390C|nr:SGNH/GDSL hydrolase family protein [Neptunomonas sp. XY-337]
MQQILVYGDSLSWGIVPGTRQRFSFAQRWPGVLEGRLIQKGHDVRVIENCLNGRRTVFSDPYKEGRDGSEGLAQVMEINAPLSLVIVVLGTNDFQMMHSNNAWSSAQGIVKLLDIIKSAPIEPGMPVPPILLAAPPPMSEPKGPVKDKFLGAKEKSTGLSDALRQVAEDRGLAFFDMGQVTASSRVDGIHLDEDQHTTVGNALVECVEALITEPL